MTGAEKGFARTVLGDIDPSEMGLTYSHEHIIIEESYPTVANPDFIINDLERVGTELSRFYSAGGRTVIDTMPADCGRNVEKLAEVSRRSGVNIIAPTGIHLEKYYPPAHWRYSYTEDQLTRLFIDDIVSGIDRHDYSGPVVERTPHRAGIIKVATGDNFINPNQEKIFRAAINAHLETGAPVITHTNGGRLALEQVALFGRLGAHLDHVVISHTDRNGDPGFHRELLGTGVRVVYESAFRWKAGEENITLRLLEELLPDFPDQITLGMDMARNKYWKSYGGNPGMNYLLEEFRAELDRRGLAEYFDRMFRHTPSRLFAFR
jgi:5-phospho-D-xylono-1,4-lactonase